MLSIEETTYADKLTKKEKKYIVQCFLIALFLRGIMVWLIYIFEDKLGPYLYIDDWKYETYAKLYSEIASKAIDINLFNNMDKQMGIVVAQLYFRFNAILYYLTSSVFFLRLANIIFSSLTVVPIFLISRELFGKREAKIASLIFTLLPYHIMMSAFLFKDILIVLMMSTSLYMILRFYKYGKINMILFFIVTVPLQWLRTGLPIFLFGVLGLAIFMRYFDKNKITKFIMFFIVSILVIIIMKFVFIDKLELIRSRFKLYMENGRDYSGNINIIRIDSLSEIYKLPLTWIFSTFFPISFRWNASSWYEILGLLNYISIFIGPGYIFYSIFHKKTSTQKLFFYPMLALHLLVIIAVINIPRHYYFLHFYMIICSSAYLAKLKGKAALIYMLMMVSLYIILAFVVFYIIG